MSDTPITITEEITTVTLDEEVTTVTVDEIITIIETDAPQGIPGPTGGNYPHQQITPSSTWTINHNLGFYPNVLIEDSAGDLVTPQKIIQNGVNQLIIEFMGAMSGKAYLS